MERQWMTRAAPRRMRTVRTDAPAHVGAAPPGVASVTSDNAQFKGTWLDPSTTAYKAGSLGSALGWVGGLWFGFVRGGHAVGWPMLGWSILGSMAGRGLGSAAGAFSDTTSGGSA